MKKVKKRYRPNGEASWVSGDPTEESVHVLKSRQRPLRSLWGTWTRKSGRA